MSGCLKWIVVGFFAIGIPIWTYDWLFGIPEPEPTQAELAAAARVDAEIAGRKACEAKIAAQAVGGHRWTNGVFQGRFESANWSSGGNLLLVGREIEFKTGSTWTPQQYACEYDPETKLAELPHIGPAAPPGKSKAAHETDGHYLCSRLIERSAQYDYDWTAGLLASRYRSIVWSGSTITYTGNEIKMQNGFGAWRRMSYACEYDTRTGVAGIIHLQ